MAPVKTCSGWQKAGASWGITQLSLWLALPSSTDPGSRREMWKVYAKKKKFKKGFSIFHRKLLCIQERAENPVLKHDQRRSAVLYYGHIFIALESEPLLESTACLKQGGKKGIRSVTRSCPHLTSLTV